MIIKFFLVPSCFSEVFEQGEGCRREAQKVTFLGKEKIKIDWSVFLDQMGDWVDNKEELWAKACNVMKRASKSERLKTLHHMAGMAHASREDDDESNISDIEWDIILRTSKELDVYDEYMDR